MEQAIEQIKEKAKNSKFYNENLIMDFYRLDQADPESVKEAIFELFENGYASYDVIYLNAGVVMEGNDSKTGINNCFQINHIGTYCFGNLLLNEIGKRRKNDNKVSYPKRIIITSSTGNLGCHPSGINYQDLNMADPTHPRHNHFLTTVFNQYMQSKLANILYVQMLDRYLSKHDILVHAVHPGCVVSDIRGMRSERSKIMVFLENCLLRSNFRGAQCHLHVGFSEEAKVVDKGGLYWDSCHPDRIVKLDDHEDQLNFHEW